MGDTDLSKKIMRKVDTK